MINSTALQADIWFLSIVQLNSTPGFLQCCHKDYLQRKKKWDDKILLVMVAGAIGLKTAQME